MVQGGRGGGVVKQGRRPVQPAALLSCAATTASPCVTPPPQRGIFDSSAITCGGAGEQTGAGGEAQRNGRRCAGASWGWVGMHAAEGARRTSCR